MTTLPHRRGRAAGLLAAISMTAVLAACSATGGSDDGGASSADMSEAGGMDAGSSAGGDAAEAPSAARDGSVSDADTGPGGPTTPDLERAVISTGAVSLSSKDVAETRRDVQRVVDAQGGEITEENTETDDEGDTSYARLVVRVPSAKFGATMQALEETGILRSSTRGSDDVTTEVIDTGVRVRAQEASLKRVELLLAEAKTLKDVIWIESQLTSRQAELDSLKSQQSWLHDQTSLSTITVDISTHHPEVEEPEEDQPAGFLVGLGGGMDALGASLVTVATIVGALLPFAILALVVGLPIWLVVRRRRQAPSRTEVPVDTPAA